MTESWQPLGDPPGLIVPGYDVGELLGYGSTGEVWRARCRRTGESVALKRLRDPGDGSAQERLRREAAVLGAISNRHVVRLHDVVTVGSGLVLVLDLAEGGSLARLVAARGPLDEGEVVTVGVPLAQALSELHCRGVVHGDVTPANVLFTGDGRPVLSDLGVLRLLGGGPSVVHGASGFTDPARDDGPPGDVHGLAATCFAALTGHPPYDVGGVRRVAGVPGRLSAALEAGLHADPSERPTAAELALALYDAAPARPVHVGGAAGPGDMAGPHALAPPTHVVRRPALEKEEQPRRHRRHQPRPRWRRPLRGALVVLLLGSGLATAVASGIAWGRAEQLPNPTARTPTPSLTTVPDRPPRGSWPTADQPPVEGWVAVLTRLDEARARAYARGDPRELASVYVPDSPAERADAAALQRLAGAGVRATGLRTTVESVEVVTESPHEVRVRVVDVLAPYVVRSGGEAVERRPGRGRATWLVTLRAVTGSDPTGVGWRIHEIVRLATG